MRSKTVLAFALVASSFVFVSAASAQPSTMHFDNMFSQCQESAGPGLGAEAAKACWEAQARLVERGMPLTEENIQNEMAAAPKYFDPECLSKVMAPNGTLIETTPEQRQSCKI